jgi:hypothetical protein
MARGEEARERETKKKKRRKKKQTGGHKANWQSKGDDI